LGSVRSSYEEIRQRWLGGQDEAGCGNRAGLAVLLRQGVATWATARSPPRASPGAVPLAPSRLGGAALLPEPSRAQMAAVLATIVWAAAQGAT
jgi:hypothetical protein